MADFRYAVSRFLAFSEDAARSVGLTPRQHQALLAIKGFRGPGAITIKALSERLHLRHNSAVELVDRLGRRRLVRRESDRQDRRVVRLRLERKGEAIIARLSAAHREELGRVGPELQQRLGRVLAGRRRARR